MNNQSCKSVILFFKIKKNRDFIFEYLADMQKFVAVHPVITKIDKISDGKFLVHETLKIGIIPFSFTYPVTIKSSEIDHSVTISATVMKVTTIKMTFVLNTDGAFTDVKEFIQFKSPLPIRTFIGNIFRKQHTQLFKNIGAVE